MILKTLFLLCILVVFGQAGKTLEPVIFGDFVTKERLSVSVKSVPVFNYPVNYKHVANLESLELNGVVMARVRSYPKRLRAVGNYISGHNVWFRGKLLNQFNNLSSYTYFGYPSWSLAIIFAK